MRRVSAMTVPIPWAVLSALTLISAPVAAQEAAPGEDSLPEAQERVIRVKILGMSCPFCAYGVEQKLKELAGVEELEVALKSGIATLAMEEGGDVPNEKLRKTVDDAGFEAAAIVRSFESAHEDWHPERLPGDGGSDATGGTDGGNESEAPDRRAAVTGCQRRPPA